MVARPIGKWPDSAPSDREVFWDPPRNSNVALAAPVAAEGPGFAVPSLQERALPPVVRHRRSYVAAKRVLDLVAASLLLAVLSPLMLLVAALVRATSPGPALFRQTRCGRNGRTFTCFKFRTMVDGADAILASDPRLRAEFVDGWKLSRDPRITRVGRWLRKSSIDELPQLWNVVKGDMSLVGPRPVRPGELRMFGDHAAALLSVRPGLTGLWQVNGRSSLPYARRVELDLNYVRDCSLGYDVLLIWRTIPAVLLGKGAV